MLIKITSQFTRAGMQYYEWDLHDGPDGIDHAHGYASDLIAAFTKILEWRERISADYASETQAELESSKFFLTDNETIS